MDFSFKTLQGDFPHSHQSNLKDARRNSRKVNWLNRRSNLPERRVRAQEVLEGLTKGLV
jgi:hypothetical protein